MSTPTDPNNPNNPANTTKPNVVQINKVAPAGLAQNQGSPTTTPTPSNGVVVSSPGSRPPAQILTAKPPFRIETAHKVDNYLNLLIYGPYGTGKTTLACTALEVEEMNDVLLISAENGDQSIAGESALMLDGLKTPLDCTKLDLIKITDFEMLARVADYLKAYCRFRDEGNMEQMIKMEARFKGVAPEEITSPRLYHTVIIDTISEIDTYCMYRILGVSDDYKIDDDIVNTEFQHYKKNNMLMLRTVRAFRDLPMHCIMTCAEQYGQDESKRYKYSPYLTGKLSGQIQAYMDMVGYLVRNTDSTGAEIRQLNVRPPVNRSFDAKNRYPKFKGAFFAQPTMRNILTQAGLLNASSK